MDPVARMNQFFTYGANDPPWPYHETAWSTFWERRVAALCDELAGTQADLAAARETIAQLEARIAEVEGERDAITRLCLYRLPVAETYTGYVWWAFAGADAAAEHQCVTEFGAAWAGYPSEADAIAAVRAAAGLDAAGEGEKGGGE